MSEFDGARLALLLLAGFRSLVDELHAELARNGHAEARPVHGFALQAIGADGATASELGRRLGVSKQAAGRTVESLERLGYARREDHPTDARSSRVRITERGHEFLTGSAVIFDDLRANWTERIGASRLRQLERDLAILVDDEIVRLDVPGWFSASDTSRPPRTPKPRTPTPGRPPGE